MDKLEIERLAKQFGTFETSILPSACCSIPAKPSTKSVEGAIKSEEAKIAIGEIVAGALRGIKRKTIALNNAK